MKREDCKLGMMVVFGRKNGEKTIGEVVKLNRAKAKVRTLEARGTNGRSGAGTEWGVPYSLMRVAPATSVAAATTMPTEEPAGDVAISNALYSIACSDARLRDALKQAFDLGVKFAKTGNV